MWGARRGLLAIAVVLPALAAGAVWALWQRCGLEGCPDVQVLEELAHDRGAIVLDRRGREVARLHRTERVIVPLDSLPAYVPAAFIAVEDRRFWTHGGIDWRRIGGAALANLRSGRIREGFSTITMQLARNVFPERLPYAERSLMRKLAEMRVAHEIEARYSKKEILELYLNRIYFGSGAWGIEAAAREYFAKGARELTLPEAALLAGMISNPYILNPRTNPRSCVRRRRVVLELMLAQGVVTPAEFAAADTARLITGRSTLREGRRAPYFIAEVRRLMEKELGEALYTGGFIIHTTLDADAQAVAEAELESQLRAVEAGQFGHYRHPVYQPGAKLVSPAGTAYLQGALIMLDAATGDVLAMVGGRDFSDSRYNRATVAERQPASTFKPIVYAAALANGHTPLDQLSDRPLRRTISGEVWTPRNMYDRYADSISLRDALVLSSNVATVRLAEDVGLDRVVDLARRLGLRRRFPRVPALALGTAEVSLLDMTTVYAAFATLGRLPTPRTVTHVEDRHGRVVWRREPRVRRALDPRIAYLVTDIMRDVIDRGTGKAVRAVGFRGPAAGKTGTSNDATDLWFIGYTPSIVTGIWIGLDLPRSIGADASSERIVAPVWGRIMRRVAPAGEQPWRPPPGVIARRIDDDGNAYAPDCAPARDLRTEYFLVGNAPESRCRDPLRNRAVRPVRPVRLDADTVAGTAAGAADTAKPAVDTAGIAKPAVDTAGIAKPAVDTGGIARPAADTTGTAADTAAVPAGQ